MGDVFFMLLLLGCPGVLRYLTPPALGDSISMPSSRPHCFLFFAFFVIIYLEFPAGGIRLRGHTGLWLSTSFGRVAGITRTRFFWTMALLIQTDLHLGKPG